MTWRVARALDVLRDEINAAAPRRSTVSDGSIGDAAHATRDSDHNPWVVKGGQGIVRARDFTHDPASGLDCNELAHCLAALLAIGTHPACRSGAYVIWNERIFSFDRRHEGWRWYGNWSTGKNPHDKHLHLSVTTDPVGFDSTHPWGVRAALEDAMPLSDEDLDRISNRLMGHQLNKAGTLDVAKALRQGAKAADALAALNDLPGQIEANLPTTSSLTRADVRTAVEAGVRDVFAQLAEETS